MIKRVVTYEKKEVSLDDLNEEKIYAGDAGNTIVFASRYKDIYTRECLSSVSNRYGSLSHTLRGAIETMVSDGIEVYQFDSQFDSQFEFFKWALEQVS